MTVGPANLSTNVAAFCAVLRHEHGFTIGPGELHDALRALETIGIADERRVRSALRLVCCGTHAETSVFDRAFDAFFRPPAPGMQQPAYAPRHTRPGRDKPTDRAADRPDERPRSALDESAADGFTTAERRSNDAESNDATAWQMLRARYSPLAASAQPPQLSTANFARMLAAARIIVTSIRRGRARRWKAFERGGRLDLRRTLRASLQSGGDPVDPRFFGHPLRNPRFVLLIDASRSMAEQTGTMLQFARALCERSTRVSVFFFSTELRDVTRQLCAANLDGGRLEDLGGAWGGGTKIGASFDAFVTRYGDRLLSSDTLVFIFSDGLDAGDVPLLERAMRSIARRSAGIVWLNPHAASHGYAPTARAMQAALPFLTLLTSANDARGFETLARRLCVDPRIRGRRRYF